MKNYNYRNKEWLYQKYWYEGLSAPRIAKLCGLRDEQPVYNYMDKHRINRRNFTQSSIQFWRAKGKISISKSTILGRLYKEARRVWEEWHMQKLPKGWVVHHRDYNPWNNEIWNLWALHRSIHNKIHKQMVPRKKSEEHKKQQIETFLYTQEPVQVAA